MLTCGVTLAAVLDLECERDFPPSVFVFLTTDFVLTLGGVFEWIIGVLELIIVSRSISMTFVIFSVFVTCFCVGFSLFFLSCSEVLSLDWVPATVMTTDGGMFSNVCARVAFESGAHPNTHAKLYLALSERKTNIPIATTKRIVNKMTNHQRRHFFWILKLTL